MPTQDGQWSQYFVKEGQPACLAIMEDFRFLN